MALLRQYSGSGEIVPRDAKGLFGKAHDGLPGIAGLERKSWMVRRGATTATTTGSPWEDLARLKQETLPSGMTNAKNLPVKYTIPPPTRCSIFYAQPLLLLPAQIMRGIVAPELVDLAL